MRDKVVIKNVPATNRETLGYRDINSSHEHNINQENITSDILDLYNKSNNLEKVMHENEVYTKLESTQLESERIKLLDEYKRLLQSVNELVDEESSRKKIILPSDVVGDYSDMSAQINRSTNCITPRSYSKVSKLTIVDSVTNTTYIPNSLRVTIDADDSDVISETINDLYAPFNATNDLYFIRDVATDIFVDSNSFEYIIDMPEEIMTTPYIDEVIIHPFMSKVDSVHYRHGDSNEWTKIEGIDHNKVIMEDDFDTHSPIHLSFKPVRANQLKIKLSSSIFSDGETNLRHFAYGLKYVGVFSNEHIEEDLSYMSTSLVFDEENDTIIIDSLSASFNNEEVNSQMQNDINYEFYYKNQLGVYQYISESLPFTAPSKDIMVKMSIGLECKHMNIAYFMLNYRVIADSHKLLVSFMDDIKCDMRSDLNLYYAVRSNQRSLGVNPFENDLLIVRHEITFDNGLTWQDIHPSFNGLRYHYVHKAFNNLVRYDHCAIRVTDFDSAIGLSNTFVIDALILDDKPILDSPAGIIQAKANRDVVVKYRAYDDFKIVSHHFSDDGGQNFSLINPAETPPLTGINRFSQFDLTLNYNHVGIKNCQIKVSDGVNDFVYSTPFIIEVAPVLIESLSLKDSAFTINVNETILPFYQILPEDATDKTVYWSSSEPTIASVDNVGVITGHYPGQAVITIKSRDGGFTDSLLVTVKIPVSSVTVSPTILDMYVGESYQLSHTVAPSSATNKNVTFFALNSSVTVSSTGLVTARSGGSSGVNVISDDSGVVATCLINVKVPVSGITLTKTSSTISAGGSDQLAAIIQPPNASNKDVLWLSDDTNIVTVDALGNVFGVDRGTTRVTATTVSKGLTAYCDYTVIAKVYGVNLSKSSDTMFVGDTLTIPYALLPTNADIPDVRWSSSNTQVATVDENGLIVGVGLGESRITITTVDGGYSDYCTIRVASRITDIIQNPKNLKLLNVNNSMWGKDVTLSLANFDPINTFAEPIFVTSSDTTIVNYNQLADNLLTTEIQDTITFRAYGTGTGEEAIKISLPEDRIVREVPCQVGPPIRSYNFIDSEIINGIQNISLLGGFSREVEYTLDPVDSIFNLSNAEGTVTTRGNGQTNLVFYGEDLIANFSHGRVVESCLEGWDEQYNLAGFYHSLPDFKVNWIPNGYSFTQKEINLNVRKEDSITLQVSVEIDDTITLQGDINSYNFIDSLILYNVNGSGAVGLRLVSSLSNSRGATLNIELLNANSLLNTNTVLLRGQFAKEDVVINLTVIN